MHKGLFGQQSFFTFNMIFIGDTAVHRTHCRTLGLFVKTFALRTFIGYYIVDLITNRFLSFFGIHCFAIGKNHRTIQIRTIGISPIICTFIDRSVRAFRFTGSTINTFVGDYIAIAYLFLTLRKFKV